MIGNFRSNLHIIKSRIGTVEAVQTLSTYSSIRSGAGEGVTGAAPNPVQHPYSGPDISVDTCTLFFSL